MKLSSGFAIGLAVAVAAGSASAETARGSSPRFRISAEISSPIFITQELRDFWPTSLRVGAGASSRIGCRAALSLLVDVAHGRPNGADECGDCSSDSRVDIVSLVLCAGETRRIHGGKGYVRYAVGPALCWVRERNTYFAWEEFLVSGRHATDERSEWRPGVDLLLEAGRFNKWDSLSFGVFARFSLITWESRYEKRLITDSIESNSLLFASVGISLGYSLY